MCRLLLDTGNEIAKLSAVYCSLPSHTAIATMTNKADYLGETRELFLEKISYIAKHCLAIYQLQLYSLHYRDIIVKYTTLSKNSHIFYALSCIYCEILI